MLASWPKFPWLKFGADGTKEAARGLTRGVFHSEESLYNSAGGSLLPPSPLALKSL